MRGGQRERLPVGNRAQPPSIPTVQMGRQAREAKASAQGHTARPRILTPRSEGNFPYRVRRDLRACGASRSKAAVGPHHDHDPEKTHSQWDMLPLPHCQGPEEEVLAHSCIVWT